MKNPEVFDPAFKETQDLGPSFDANRAEDGSLPHPVISRNPHGGVRVG